ncbi:MAG TPA: CDP-alcohol phosphatidyltransferase family protein [Acidimicrobiales bacterium]|nr:CDP-alcohol phosphatidyltransferase family protein [Acidimicrobiales bacterium]
MPAPDPAPDAGAPAGPAAGGATDTEDRVLTAANVVSSLRFLGIGVFLWLLFGAGDQTVAAVLLGVLGATDWVDGQLARRLHQVSRLGKVLDPAVDRVLVGTAVIAVIVHGAVPLWFGVLTVVREALVSSTVLVLAALGARRIDVLWIGKAGTFGLMVAYPGFLISLGSAGWQQPFHDAAWAAGGAGIVLAWAAALAYLVPARRALAEGRAGRRGGDDGRGVRGSIRGPGEVGA